MAVLHLLAGVVLVKAFTPELANDVVRAVTHSFDVPLRSPPQPRPEAPEKRRPDPVQEQGAAGAPGKRAKPRDASVPKATIVIRPTEAPPVAGAGHANAAGASPSGSGTGAGGQGAGLGAGSGGSGTGGGLAVKPVKVTGDINSARDYPRASRDLRLGHQVVVILRVGVDGAVKGCRVLQPSPDADADRITCQLASERFRFRPARNAAGDPVEADYGWRQRWFLSGQSSDEP